MQPRATRLSSYQFNVSAAVYDDYAKSSRNRRFRLWSIDRQIFRTNEVGVVAAVSKAGTAKASFSGEPPPGRLTRARQPSRFRIRMGSRSISQRKAKRVTHSFISIRRQ